MVSGSFLARCLEKTECAVFMEGKRGLHCAKNMSLFLTVIVACIYRAVIRPKEVQWMKINCLECPVRGECCKEFKIVNKGRNISLDEGYVQKEQIDDFLIEQKLPFNVIGLDDAEWLFSCDMLDEKTGLCSKHEKRPLICRNYIPGSAGTLCHELFKQNALEWLTKTTREVAAGIYKTFLA